MYPQYNNLPDRITRQVKPSSSSSSSLPPPLSPSSSPPPINTNPRIAINSINKQISLYLNHPTKTWLAVQKSKNSGAKLVYYYEPEDQHIHFASNGLPVHDQHFFDGEAGFFSGVDEEVGVVEVGGGAVRRSVVDGGVGEGRVDGEGDTNTDVHADAVGGERKEDFLAEMGKDSAVCLGYDYEDRREMYRSLGTVEPVSGIWDGGRCDGHDEEPFTWMAAPSVVASEEMDEVGVWSEEWNMVFE